MLTTHIPPTTHMALQPHPSCLHSTASPWVPFPALKSRPSSCISALDSSLRAYASRNLGAHPGGRAACLVRRSLRITSIFDVAEKGPSLKVETVAPPPSGSPAAASAIHAGNTGCHFRTFENVSTEQDLLQGILKEVETKRIPAKAGYGMKELYYNYRDAVREGGLSDEKIVKIMATVLDRILLQFEEPFTFPSYHLAIREPYDYYVFGQNYIRPLVDFRNSVLGNAARFADVEQQLKEGHNVVLFANHQTEADPAVMALLLESCHPYLSEQLTYIAGDRVVLDPFCKPFSMGRNLICVYSKKHINDIPELVDMKRKANARALKDLTLLFREGGKLVWIAPSGGRDRPDPSTSKWTPAPFDAGPVENMRRLIEHSKAPGHMYPLSLHCHNIMPPPPVVQKEIGERRLLGFTGVGMSIAPEIEFKEIVAECEGQMEASEHFSQAVWKRVQEQYAVLDNAVDGKQGTAASTKEVVLSQPWTHTSSSACNEHSRVPCHS